MNVLERLAQRYVTDLLAQAGISVNGSEPHHMRVRDNRTFLRVLTQGSLGLGESYMDGWWDCEQLDTLVCRMLKFGLDQKARHSPPMIMTHLAGRLLNRQRGHAYEIGKQHYDIGNDLFRRMLDSRMQYSCAYWRHIDSAHPNALNRAQHAKMELICRKLKLEPGMRVLDIGCGWGGLAKYMAETYRVTVVGVTVSREQKNYAENLCSGLPVEILYTNYLDVYGTFDRVVSVGMFEHVGYKNYSTFMRFVRDHLIDGGLALLHTIGRNGPTVGTDPWIGKYIFPNSMLPSVDQIAQAYQPLLVMEDWHNFGADYDRTLMAWHRNFEATWDEIADRYDDRFRRMWRFYLLSCAGAFRARKIQLWQIVLSKNGIPGGYHPVR